MFYYGWSEKLRYICKKSVNAKFGKHLASNLFSIQDEIPARFDKLLDKVHISTTTLLSTSTCIPFICILKDKKTKKNRRIGGCTYGAIIG
jgi:hypothetical protein